MKQCICQICVCGRHHCEHTKHRIPYAKDKDENKISEHKDRYRHFGYQPPALPVLPTGGADWKGSEPTVKLSTTKRDYVPFPIEKRTAKRQQSYNGPKGKMDSSTTYQHDYKPKKGQMRSKIKGAEGTKDGTMPGTLPGKMVGETTYGKAYTQKPCSRREQAKAKEGTLTKLGQPFLGTTETGQRYQAPPYSKREMMRPLKSELKNEGEFEGITTHKLDYSPKFQVPPKPFKKLQKWQPNTGKFEGMTTHAHDYKCPPLSEKPQLSIPQGSLQRSEGPFEGVSHYKENYQPHEIGPRKVPKWHPSLRSHKLSTEPMTGKTTYKTDYEAPPEDSQPPSKSKAAKNNLTLPNGAMEKTTTSMRDYRKFDNPVLSKSCKQDTEYKKPEGKFADCTTTKCDYTPKTGDRAKTSKQTDNLGLEGGPMDDLTTTMRDFQWMCLDCPAKYIKLYGKDALPQYRFEKTEKGHDYFKKLKNTDKSQD